MKKILTVIILSLLLISLPLSASAYDYEEGSRTALINDLAELLDEDAEFTLNSKLEQISELNECEVAILTVNTTDGMDITEYSDDFYDYNGFGYGENDDGIMLVINMGTREFATTTHGTAIDIFTDYNLSQLENEFIPYLSQGEYENAFIAFYEKCESIFADYENYQENYDGGYVYFPDDDDDGYVYFPDDGKPSGFKGIASEIFSIKWLIVSVIIGIVIAFIYTAHLKGQLKTVRSKSAASDYIVPDSMQLTQQRDVFMYRNVSKTAKPKNNSSGGTRSGGSSFGGGSSTHSSSSGRTHGGSRGSF